MTNIVFIHGLWVAHTSWEPWITYFAEHGHRAIAPAWPGELPTVEETRDQASAQAGFGIDELTAHYARVLEQFDTPPVVIGHSFGGLIAQKLLGENKAAAAVAIDPAPIKGVKPLPLTQLRSALPVLGNPLNRGRAKALTPSQWRYGFGNALSSAESDALWEQWSIPRPASRCSRRRRPTSLRIRRLASTPPTPPEDRCSSPEAPPTTPCRWYRPKPRTGSTGIPRP
ncbi:lysophospholipase [Mycolicibacterium chubuense]|uniref:alpha/beta hydrolase n=1 Tax=Mycolicibacterium chubuense TaxID=1800 RepID=UPI000D814622|nr:alpha/beta hydrolase [Mycolicibacterium chubuense]SPX95836.1 lysophospholipase [Mycolicibacterium chubuense]